MACGGRQSDAFFSTFAADEETPLRPIQNVKETRIHEETDAPPGDARRDLFQNALHYEARSGVGARITGTQRAMPKLLAMAFKAENRMVGTPTLGFWIVSNTSALLFAVESEHDGIQMKLQRTSRLGKRKEIGAYLIMEPDNLADGIRRQAL
jgi:hypothetical protein